VRVCSGTSSDLGPRQYNQAVLSQLSTTLSRLDNSISRDGQYITEPCQHQRLTPIFADSPTSHGNQVHVTPPFQGTPTIPVCNSHTSCMDTTDDWLCAPSHLTHSLQTKDPPLLCGSAPKILALANNTKACAPELIAKKKSRAVLKIFAKYNQAQITKTMHKFQISLITLDAFDVSKGNTPAILAWCQVMDKNRRSGAVTIKLTWDIVSLVCRPPYDDDLSSYLQSGLGTRCTI
jgi:hypothetical protein